MNLSRELPDLGNIETAHCTFAPVSEMPVQALQSTNDPATIAAYALAGLAVITAMILASVLAALAVHYFNDPLVKAKRKAIARKSHKSNR